MCSAPMRCTMNCTLSPGTMGTHGPGRTPQQRQLVPSVTRGCVACDLFLIWAIVNHESVKRDLCWVFQRRSSLTLLCAAWESARWTHQHHFRVFLGTCCCLSSRACDQPGAQDALMGRLPGLYPVPRSTPQQQGPASSSFQPSIAPVSALWEPDPKPAPGPSSTCPPRLSGLTSHALFCSVHPEAAGRSTAPILMTLFLC